MLEGFYKYSNEYTLPPIPKCNEKYPGEEWKCLFIENNIEFIN